ncbi:MAG: CPBP family intramembrane metalloprotease [Puniceicoccales bacterium]|jgi:membrane protease YdiL (CAAX protease family)|nr:CPBP family intramembrane metalloprotease [Puniceicoccales bacterium]
MGALLPFASIYLLALLLTTFLAPNVYGFFRWWDGCRPSILSHYIAAKPFSKIFGRIFLIHLAIGLIFLLRHHGLFSWKNLGHWGENRGRGGSGKFFPKFFALGLLLTFPICLCQALVYGWHEKQINLPFAIVFSFGGALVVAFLEEVIFRGYLIRVFSAAFGRPAALLTSSFIFAGVHFHGPPLSSSASAIAGWPDSLRVAGGIFFGAVRGFRPVPFFSLFLLGVLLGLIFLRYRHLTASIGFHCGVVLVLLLHRRTISLTVGTPSAFWGTNILLDSVLCPLLLLLPIGFCLHGFRQKFCRDGP